MGNPTQSLKIPSLAIDILRQSHIPLYVFYPISCFWSLTFILSEGKEIIDVRKEANSATTVLWCLMLKG
jgi:hypothetical protein